MHWEKEGAFTGEISAPMLNAIRVTHVIIGHSERREYFNETDDTVNRKLELALENGFTPIVCVGEVLEEREAGLTEDVLRRQCMRAFDGISAKKAAKMTSKPLHQAVIAPSMMYLLYQLDGDVPGYPRKQFEDDIVNECEKDIRSCFAAGAA